MSGPTKLQRDLEASLTGSVGPPSVAAATARPDIGWRPHITRPADQSWWMASRTLSRDARRAGKEAATSPARVATIT